MDAQVQCTIVTIEVFFIKNKQLCGLFFLNYAIHPFI